MPFSQNPGVWFRLVKRVFLRKLRGPGLSVPCILLHFLRNEESKSLDPRQARGRLQSSLLTSAITANLPKLQSLSSNGPPQPCLVGWLGMWLGQEFIATKAQLTATATQNDFKKTATFRFDQCFNTPAEFSPLKFIYFISSHTVTRACETDQLFRAPLQSCSESTAGPRLAADFLRVSKRGISETLGLVWFSPKLRSESLRRGCPGACCEAKGTSKFLCASCPRRPIHNGQDGARKGVCWGYGQPQERSAGAIAGPLSDPAAKECCSCYAAIQQHHVEADSRQRSMLDQDWCGKCSRFCFLWPHSTCPRFFMRTNFFPCLTHPIFSVYPTCTLYMHRFGTCKSGLARPFRPIHWNQVMPLCSSASFQRALIRDFVYRACLRRDEWVR